MTEWSRSKERRACFDIVPIASTGAGKPQSDCADCL